MKYGDSAEFWNTHEEKVRGSFVGWCAGGSVNGSIDTDGNDKIYLCRSDSLEIRKYAFMRAVPNVK